MDKSHKHKNTHTKRVQIGNPLAVQCLGLGASIAGGMGSIPGWGTKIPHAVGHGQKNKRVHIIYKPILLGERRHRQGASGMKVTVCFRIEVLITQVFFTLKIHRVVHFSIIML